MSGGSYDYFYHKLEELDIRPERSAGRAAFQELLKLIASAMHDIEWVDSCDYGAGDENEAIDKCFSFMKADPEVIAKAHAYDHLKRKLTEWLEIDPGYPPSGREEVIEVNGTFLLPEEVCSVEAHIVREYTSPSISDNSMHATFNGVKVILKNGRKIYIDEIKPQELILKLGIETGSNEYQPAEKK